MANLFVLFFYWMLCAGVGVEVEAGAGVEARAGVGVQIVAIGGNQFSLTEIEADQEFQLKCAKILLVEDAGEVVIVSYYMRVIPVMMIAGKVDTGKAVLQNILHPLLLGIIH